MSELTLTLLRLGLLVALWLFVFGVLSTLRRDLFTEARTAQRPLRRSTSAVRARTLLHHRRGAHLIVSQLDGTTRRIPLGDDPVTFGNTPDNTVVLEDDFTSGHHARVVRRERGWIIEDLGSTNGTWVERRRITVATPISDGMHVRIGRTEIVVGA